MPSDDATTAASVAASLPAARWFADKGTTIDRVVIHDRFPLPARPGSNGQEPSLAFADVFVADDATARRYCLVVDCTGGDAAGTPAFAGWLTDTVLGAESHHARGGVLVGHAAAGTAWVKPASVPRIAPLGGDASNSSFVVHWGDVGYVVKLFRRCRAGIHPEVEVGEFLATHEGPLVAPRLRGWLEYKASDGSSTAIATLHDFAPGCATAWDRLVSLLGGGGPHATRRDDVLGLVAAIGRLTGRMHRTLAARPDVVDFRPQLPTPAGRHAVVERMAGQAADVFALAESQLPRLPPAVAARLRRLLAAKSVLLGRFAGFATLAMHVPNIRLHGDYHLGQILVGDRDDGLAVIDFEGEPGRTLEERRSRGSAAKDVAGMCRSLDYALRHMAAVTGVAYQAADLRRLESRFLEAYRSEAGAWWPDDDATATALLDVHRLDKALYELAYEINNRPDWIGVPLAALEEIAATPP